MSELLALLIIILVVAYVVWPLYRLRSHRALSLVGSGNKTQDLHYQKRIATEIIEDLHFDHQTGKLGDADHQDLVHKQQRLIERLDEQLQKSRRPDSDDPVARLEAEIARQKAKRFPAHGAACPRCGKPKPNGAKFCPECGAPLT